MNKSYLTLFASTLILFAAFVPNEVQAQDEARVFPFCFTDSFGYLWDVTIDHATGVILGSVRVTVPDCGFYSVEGQFNGPNVMLTATNPRAGDDPGCSDGQGCSDWFTYDGVRTMTAPLELTMEGTWANPCSPGSGTFDGTGSVGACPPGVTRGAELATITPGGMPEGLRGTHAASASAAGYEVTSYPNPLTTSATISFTLDAQVNVRLAVYDVLGREVAVLVDEARPAGAHAVQWEANASLPAGTYVYRLTAGDRTETGRMMLVR